MTTHQNFAGYLLNTKSGDEVFYCIKQHLLVFGVCKLFQTDNGKEFVNDKLKSYLESLPNNCIFVQGRAYYPQSQGVVESVHKTNLKLERLKDGDKFNLNKSLINVLEIYNNRFHSSTMKCPNDIFRASSNSPNYESLMNEVKCNIVKSQSNKNKNLTVFDPNEKILVSNTPFSKIYVKFIINI